MPAGLTAARRRRPSAKGFGNLRKVSAKNKILWGLVFALFIAGCGLKANPVPQASVGASHQAQQKLTVSADGNAVLLVWQLQNQSGTRYMNIERSKLGSAGNICRDCPRTFERMGRLPVEDAKKMNQAYRFVDLLAQKGSLYSYRLKLCDEAGECRESQTVEIDFK